jgi:hypothetical protein
VSKPEYLYGAVGAEHLLDDPEEVAERLFDDAGGDGPFEVEQWTVRPQRSCLPSVDWLIDTFTEHAADSAWYETDEGFYEHLTNIVLVPEVRAAADAFLDAVASRIGYHMADKHVGSSWWWNVGTDERPDIREGTQDAPPLEARS